MAHAGQCGRARKVIKSPAPKIPKGPSYVDAYGVQMRTDLLFTGQKFQIDGDALAHLIVTSQAFFF